MRDGKAASQYNAREEILKGRAKKKKKGKRQTNAPVEPPMEAKSSCAREKQISPAKRVKSSSERLPLS